jgi:HlyD family type I secretion membrane fusion protein
VQHLEGGIIRDILIRDGDEVGAGETLVVMEDVDVQADFGVLMSRLRSLVAEEARLWAERDQTATIDFSHPALADQDNALVREVTRSQTNKLQSRRDNDASRVAVLEQRVAQLERQIAGLNRQLDSNRSQKTLIAEEIGDLSQLVEKGLAQKPRLLALQRSQAELVGEEGRLEASVAQAGEAIGETRLRVISLRDERDEEIAEDLAQVQSQRGQVDEQLREVRDRLARSTIKAPISGKVIGLKFKTLGGVIPSGEPILDIVPAEDELIIEARISPTDIDDVDTNSPAYVTFPSLPQRRVMRIEGRVTSISADAMTDPTTQASYFLGRIEVDREALLAAGNVELTPGMPAEVYIETQERTVLTYLLQPFLQSVERSFREN